MTVTQACTAIETAINGGDQPLARQVVASLDRVLIEAVVMHYGESMVSDYRRAAAERYADPVAVVQHALASVAMEEALL